MDSLWFDDREREKELQALLPKESYVEKFSKPCKGLDIEYEIPSISPFTGVPFYYSKLREDTPEILRESLDIYFRERDEVAKSLSKRLFNKGNDFVIYKGNFWPKNCELPKVVKFIKVKDKVITFGGKGSKGLPKLLKSMALDRGYKFLNTPIIPRPANILGGYGSEGGYKVVNTRGPGKFEIGDSAFVTFGTDFWKGQVVEIIDGPRWVKSGFGSYRIRSREDPAREIWIKSGSLSPMDSEVYCIEEVQL